MCELVDEIVLSPRIGERPATSLNQSLQQISDQASPEFWGRLNYEVFLRDDIYAAPSGSKCPDSRGVFFIDKEECLSEESSLVDLRERLEPVHLHNVFDTSIHLTLPLERAKEVSKLGWGEPDPHSTSQNHLVIYGPRNEVDLAVILQLIRESISYSYHSN